MTNATKTATHTPRPWHYTSEFEAKEFCGVRCMTIDAGTVGDHDGAHVLAYMPPFGDQPQIHANARLIAAAPDMYATLLEISIDSSSLPRNRKAASAAIAKAEGGGV